LRIQKNKKGGIFHAKNAKFSQSSQSILFVISTLCDLSVFSFAALREVILIFLAGEVNKTKMQIPLPSIAICDIMLQIAPPNFRARHLQRLKGGSIKQVLFC
jgi:hypothetical protein